MFKFNDIKRASVLLQICPEVFRLLEVRVDRLPAGHFLGTNEGNVPSQPAKSLGRFDVNLGGPECLSDWGRRAE
jgi:hypothetical protein